ncbi:MAG: septum formation protein Maf [Deltaproteobacteria bacterium]|nr:septum formation protein Maf [Deltaproteobacteria bacterium]
MVAGKLIILASSSPRRRLLLKKLGFKVKVFHPKIKEKRKFGETPKKMVKRLAIEKGVYTLKKIGSFKTATILLSADTIVVAPDQKTILGKPKNINAAKKMLTILSGKTHQVLTGYCLLLFNFKKNNSQKTITRVVSSRVKIKKLSKAVISKYVNTKEPYDKAGAYAAQGKASRFIDKIYGSYTNVVGLPVEKLLEDIKRLIV